MAVIKSKQKKCTFHRCYHKLLRKQKWQTVNITPDEQPAANPLLNNSAHDGQENADCGNGAAPDTDDAKAAKLTRKAIDDHLLRYHSKVPVRYYCPTNSCYVKVSRDPAKNMAFQCACKKTFDPRSSISRHFTTCKKALSAVASLAKVAAISPHITLFNPAPGIHPKSTELREETIDVCIKPEPEICGDSDVEDDDENRSVSDGDKDSEYDDDDDDDDITGDIENERRKQNLEPCNQGRRPMQQGNGHNNLVSYPTRSQHEQQRRIEQLEEAQHQDRAHIVLLQEAQRHDRAHIERLQELMDSSLQTHEELMESSLEAQQYRLDSGLKAQQSHLDSSLKAQQSRLDSGLQTHEELMKSSLEAQQYLLDSGLQSQLSRLDSGLQAQQSHLDSSLKAQQSRLDSSLQAQRHRLDRMEENQQTSQEQLQQQLNHYTQCLQNQLAPILQMQAMQHHQQSVPPSQHQAQYQPLPPQRPPLHQGQLQQPQWQFQFQIPQQVQCQQQPQQLPPQGQPQ
ncbi:hypothetical protein BGX27_001288, partial [Mortierella sp. AM989]